MKFTALQQHQINVLQLGREVRPELPDALVLFQAGCANIVRNPQMFPMLGCGKHQTRRLFTSINRERRPERLQKCAQVLAVLPSFSDLMTLSDGQRVNGETKAITELQLGRAIGIQAPAGEELTHDTRGMRAMRAAERDLEDAELISRKQPKVQYCNAAAGGCGQSIQRGRSCKCGRRHCWRWRALPTIITIQKRAFEAMGLRERLEEQQAERYAQQQRAKGYPEPERDIRRERVQRRLACRQRRAAASTGIETKHDPKLVAEQQRRLERLYGEKKRE